MLYFFFSRVKVSFKDLDYVISIQLKQYLFLKIDYQHGPRRFRYYDVLTLLTTAWCRKRMPIMHSYRAVPTTCKLVVGIKNVREVCPANNYAQKCASATRMSEWPTRDIITFYSNPSHETKTHFENSLRSHVQNTIYTTNIIRTYVYNDVTIQYHNN